MSYFTVSIYRDRLVGNTERMLQRKLRWSEVFWPPNSVFTSALTPNLNVSVDFVSVYFQLCLIFNIWLGATNKQKKKTTQTCANIFVCSKTKHCIKIVQVMQLLPVLKIV